MVPRCMARRRYHECRGDVRYKTQQEFPRGGNGERRVCLMQGACMRVRARNAMRCVSQNVRARDGRVVRGVVSRSRRCAWHEGVAEPCEPALRRQKRRVGVRQMCLCHKPCSVVQAAKSPARVKPCAVCYAVRNGGAVVKACVRAVKRSANVRGKTQRVRMRNAMGKTARTPAQTVCAWRLLIRAVRGVVMKRGRRQRIMAQGECAAAMRVVNARSVIQTQAPRFYNGKRAAIDAVSR